MKKLVWLNAQVAQDFAIKVRAAAVRENISKSELIRRAVADYIIAREDKYGNTSINS